MKIGYLGAGSWGFSLASLLASKGFHTISWSPEEDVIARLQAGKDHPFLVGYTPRENMVFTTHIEDALQDIDFLIEGVTSTGVRPVFEQVKNCGVPSCPIVITSKGIEQGTGLILPEIVLDILGEGVRNRIAEISGPGYAKEVVQQLPTSVVASAYEPELMMKIRELFSTPTFRVYPNKDVVGVAFGGAMKNVIAIACGMADGMGLGNSAKASLMTRGLHEMRKLAVARGGYADTLNGLAGMGDLILTCSSLMSRNNKFGYLLAQGLSPQEAEKEIKMVVEGTYTCRSAMELGNKLNIPMPVTEAIYNIIEGKLSPQQAVKALMERDVKEEHL